MPHDVAHVHAKHGWLCASMAQEPARRARHVSVMSPNENVVYLSQFMLFRYDKDMLCPPEAALCSLSLTVTVTLSLSKHETSLTRDRHGDRRRTVYTD